MIRLLIHGHLIVDDYRQYEDGCLLIDDKHILDVFVNSNKIDDVYYDEVIDLKGNIVMPNVYDLSLLDTKQIIVDPLNESVQTDKVVMLGNSKAYSKDVHINYDGYYNLFNNMTGFDVSDFGLVNRAFEDYDKYVEIDGSLDISVLKVVYKLIRKDRIILINDVLGGLRKFKEIGANYNELLMFSSLNAYCLFKMDKEYGSLIKGKNSRLMIFAEDFREVDYV